VFTSRIAFVREEKSSGYGGRRDKFFHKLSRIEMDATLKVEPIFYSIDNYQ
jgi:hypothetical protein